MELRHLRYFKVLAETLNFTRAGCSPEAYCDAACALLRPSAMASAFEKLRGAKPR